MHDKHLKSPKPIIMKIFTLYLLALLIGVDACNQTNKSATQEEETATTTEPENEWITLFDGETLEGWKRYGADNVGPLWSVEDGAIKCDGEGLTEGTEDIGGTLITTRHYKLETSFGFLLII